MRDLDGKHDLRFNEIPFLPVRRPSAGKMKTSEQIRAPVAIVAARISPPNPYLPFGDWPFQASLKISFIRAVRRAAGDRAAMLPWPECN